MRKYLQFYAQKFCLSKPVKTYLFLALAAIFFYETICAIFIEGIKENICVNYFEFWASGSEKDVILSFFLFLSSGGLFSSMKSFLEFWKSA